jgi:hypothetical protein
MMKWEKDRDAFGREVWRATAGGKQMAILPTRTGSVLSVDSVPVDSGRENGRFRTWSDAAAAAEVIDITWGQEA